jgi:hypothetical protein
MKQDKQKTNWLIDAGLFAGFIGSLWLDLTGVAAHQWLGLAVAAFAVYHLWKHWTWVKAVGGRFFGGTSGRVRACYLIDAGLAAGFAAITATGLVISTWLGLALPAYATWHAVHVGASVATLALLVAKFGLHWRWIVDVARRKVFGTTVRAPVSPAVPAAVSPAVAPLGRRDFVKLMAGAGTVALLSGVNALGAVKIDAVEAAPESASSNTAASSAAASSTVASSGSCVIRCNKRCSYPGRCRRYTDSNNNGRCDLGECAA